ncbi:MAG: FdhF/YdeP family oxidoreductase [Methylacidiphilales bacterium]|nr:FdhF/YdeP family oxidoreductase [Candidatus Methylacidiphilales bacterium]
MNEPRTPAPGVQSPEDSGSVRIGKSSKAAAGVPGVLQAGRFAWKEMGLVRSVRTLLKLNQKKGFDCQSCAWPTSDEGRHVFEFCENGAKAAADEATTKRITPDFFREHSVTDLAARSDYWLGQQGRLMHPMILREGATHYEPIEWDEAFKRIAAELNALGSPNEAAFYTSGRTSNEAAFLYQLFARQFGTNNLPDCSNMCHESSGAALSETIGIGKGCVMLEDFEKADAIFIIGQNPGTNHPRMLISLEAAKARGCAIVSINPLPEVGNFRFKNPQNFQNPLRALPTLLGKGTSLSNLWLQVQINGDLALFQGIMKEMLADEDRQPGSVFDHAFIREHTTGFDEFIEALRRTSWEEIMAGSGLTRESIRHAADIAVRSKRIICCWAMGLTQHKNAVATIQSVMNFLFLGGHIGRPGAGPCPVRGHSNVQGDRTMGIWERMGDAFLDRLGAEFGFQPPRDHGADTVDALKAMHEGRIKAFFALGGNFLSATPDTNFTAQALSKCRLTAQVSTKLNRAHLITGRTALILPCLGRTEIDRQAAGGQFVTVEDSMGIINSSRGHLEPASAHLLSEPAIIARLARATLCERGTVDWESLAGNYDRIRDSIERVVPGFERYNERIRLGVFHLPNPARDERRFGKGGRAKFTVHPIPVHTLAPGQFMMMTMRSHDQFNTTIYGLDDRYRGVFNGRRVVFLNAEDMAEAGLQQGQLVDLTSHFEGVERIAPHFFVAPYSIPRRCAATYFPEANVLVPINSVADRSNTPASKSVIITIAPSPDAEAIIADLARDLSNRS